MARCSSCNTFILFGGVRDESARYCSDDCFQRSQFLAIADQIDQQELKKIITETHQGNCPQCEGPGPIELHNSYRIWSAIVLTQWSTKPQISCQSCATKARLGSTFFCFFLGWWGFPWGLIMTPIQIIRNLAGFAKSIDPTRPSPQFVDFMRVTLAAHILEEVQRNPQSKV